MIKLPPDDMEKLIDGVHAAIDSTGTELNQPELVRQLVFDTVCNVIEGMCKKYEKQNVSGLVSMANTINTSSKV